MIHRLAKQLERFILWTLIAMMAIVLVIATIELGYHLLKSFQSNGYLLLDLNTLPDLFGAFLLILIGIELLETIKIYFRESIVHVEVVVLVAIIAIARKVVVIKIEDLSGVMLMGIGVLIAALALAYFLIKKAGLLRYDLKRGLPEKKECPNTPKKND
ncbi:uncharacterized membrane protein (DUF373 family) [Breznakibacter xylanolyticus]|uniref:Uncharacterized membrane protein (DUF373 family) n=1 Tax=Breznakibacter xylanolyticus TaxID=990 RepID=A0A2W7PAR8_9BACT|nr:phosphate-starvation-inducible PsiE family protein [Breznakibacter xylanolyticus]MBN2742813.1 phosphate-starvation-inducible PsiE family protein [Marinilabiliaceae bacterium]PZX20402.1 uncharacterized membrane protein (DUF373 family) [Breznakibacter xylanolyticus]